MFGNDNISPGFLLQHFPEGVVFGNASGEYDGITREPVEHRHHPFDQGLVDAGTEVFDGVTFDDLAN